MSASIATYKDLFTCKYQSEGISIFPKGSSVLVPPIAVVEVKGKAYNLSKFTPKLHLLKIGDLSLLVETSLQIDGGYVAKTSTDNFDAVGEGDTETEAIEDIKSAIKLLKEAVSEK